MWSASFSCGNLIMYRVVTLLKKRSQVSGTCRPDDRWMNPESLSIWESSSFGEFGFGGVDTILYTYSSLSYSVVLRFWLLNYLTPKINEHQMTEKFRTFFDINNQETVLTILNRRSSRFLDSFINTSQLPTFRITFEVINISRRDRICEGLRRAVRYIR